jgi:hypothetical protein
MDIDFSKGIVYAELRIAIERYGSVLIGRFWGMSTKLLLERFRPLTQ